MLTPKHCPHNVSRAQARAWAAAEKESVEKWVSEQRALIKKDRHKAANAALIASKKANRAKDGDDDEGLFERQEAMKAELKGLRAEMKKMRAKDGQDIARLKEVIRRQERTINALKSGAKEGGAAAATVKNDKSPNSNKASGGGVAAPRRALGEISSKQNAQTQQQQQSQPSSNSKAARRTSNEGATSRAKRTEIAVPVEQDDAVNDSLTEDEEEPTEQWLQRHLAQLKSANNRLGQKVVVDEDAFDQQRKPYNAADYGGGDGTDNHDYPVQSLSRSNGQSNNNPAVPQFVTAPSPSNAIAPPAGQHQQQQQPKSQIFTYKNGTQKEVLPDGTTTVSFANGDRKRTYANEKKGIVVYYYAATKVTPSL